MKKPSSRTALVALGVAALGLSGAVTIGAAASELPSGGATSSHVTINDHALRQKIDAPSVNAPRGTNPTSRPALAPTSMPTRPTSESSVHTHADGTSHVHRAPRTLPKDDRSKGQVYDGLAVARSGGCKGVYQVKAHPTKCSHGPDPVWPGYSMSKRVAPLTQQQLQQSTLAGDAQCFGTGTDGPRVQVLYVYSGTNRFDQYKSSFQQWALGMDKIYDDSAAKTGGIRHIRFVTDSQCIPTVIPVQVSSSALSDFGSMMSALQQQGYTRQDRKYTVFGDANVYCGIGEFTGDSRKTSSNQSNYGPSFARTDANCWGSEVIAHELGHNLGAVNNNAPNSSGGAHCTDEYDVMCYSDSPYYPQMRYICTNQANDALLDCGNNDYFHSNPTSGYLAQYWNMADSVFLEKQDGGGSPNPTPTPTSTSTSPSPTSTSGGCTYPTTASSSLSAGAVAIVPSNSYYYSGGSGTHASCLTGPSGSDFDLYFQKWNGSQWVTVASSTGETSSEKVSYNGTAGYYRWYIYAYSGSGSYTLKYGKPA
ncbi:hypothetical protein PZ938_13365 [Luteipulveratus sp. YIM 133132]|uniref:reprolysin-like metallopeptidase n=1 Tax=Luteipulveratus flavus TaxID=3031728 RepID=UPI0023B0BAA3|nr:hypothetical protein [Luteipulveratus sp. YIM 133132]MDE9366596.1 hypothetical protein [Luteipulveratus sp. YIM 133132]